MSSLMAALLTLAFLGKGEAGAVSVPLPQPGPVRVTSGMLACSELASSFIATGRAGSRDLTAAVKTGSEWFRVVLGEQIVTINSKAESAAGSPDGTSYRIAESSASAIVAVSLEASGTVSSFTLNRTSGWALWTRTRPDTLLGGNGPEAQVVYFRCAPE